MDICRMIYRERFSSNLVKSQLLQKTIDSIVNYVNGFTPPSDNDLRIAFSVKKVKRVNKIDLESYNELKMTGYKLMSDN